MKPEELRKGNLFEYDGKIFRVKEIRDYIIVGDRGKGNVDFTIKEISPIELTEEWLIKFSVKCKFLHLQKLDNKVLRLDCNSVNDIALWISEDEDTIEESDSSFNLKNIKYVHQLQNLYFALTGEELTFS